jgi:hypothetical protein
MFEELRARIWLALHGCGWRWDLTWVDGVGEQPCIIYTRPLSEDILWRLGERFKCNVYSSHSLEEYYELT